MIIQTKATQFDNVYAGRMDPKCLTVWPVTVIKHSYTPVLR